ncbi:DUF4389 domain-containing protein [Poseidonocella sedimentorum]|uniref:DUF4389 domain-containing protein n=1 Tax=Poseidonocella sedimentorum TaxID=871652 RepID=A0A1I6DYZ8_9RHOB|nr:DUF4389 domain-containing protein [Poseidonocella sedimentorum]SFR10508.1 protein of unknown function [Poseidonocella sedimentorum]
MAEHDHLDGRIRGERPEPEARDGLLMRLIFTVLIAILINLAQTVLVVVTVIQFVIMLLHGGKPNDRLAEFGLDLGVWIAKAVRYQTAGSDVKPWPWTDLD